MIIGYTYVVGDIIHKGHILYLKNARSLCDRLIVGVLTDEAVMEKKHKPTISFIERMLIVDTVKYVNLAIRQDTYSPLDNCKMLKPDILIESSSHKEMPANEFMTSLNKRVVVLPYFKEQSSTAIKEKIKHDNKNDDGVVVGLDN